MGKTRDLSKSRKWEQLRRERLNETFSDLYKELPSKGDSSCLSKKAILNEAVSFIRQLQREKKELQERLAQQRSPNNNNDIPDATTVRTHFSILLQRQNVLLHHLQNAGIVVPSDPSVDQVSSVWSPKIFQNGTKSPEDKDTSSLDKKKKATTPVITPANGAVHRVVLAEKTKPMNPLSRKNNKECNSKKKTNKKIATQAPLVLQSLPSQLLLTQGSTPAVPVIVTVGEVKTLNPVIVVQSKPIVTCNTTASFSARPIRPCPAVKPPASKAKVPIPALKPKHNISVRKKVAKSKGKSVTKEPVKNAQTPITSGGTGSETTSQVPEEATTNLNKNTQHEGAQTSSVNIQEPLVDNRLSYDSGSKESGKRLVKNDDSTPVTKKMKTAEIDQENSKELGYINGAPVQNTVFTSSPSKSTLKSGSYSISALCSLEQQQNQQQQEQQQQLDHQQQLLHQHQQQDLQQQHKQHEQQQDSLPKQHRQQIQQQQQDKRQSKKQHQQDQLQQVQQQIENHQQQQTCVQSTAAPQTATKPVCVVSKPKEVYVPSNEQYLEWVEKSGSKSRFDTRTYPTYNTFTTQVHNSRNSFMPISEAEVFDGSENAFGLSLNTPDISSDLFTSLQVPNGGHHSESISPTAAFLLTFPLVSTSKASELLPDEGVCDNNDSQSGMKTILQIGNIDSDKCGNSIFSVADDGLTNFSLPQFTNQKDPQIIRNISEEKTANKDCTDNLVVLVQKEVESSLNQNALFMNKNQSQQNNQSKPDQSTTIVSTVEIPATKSTKCSEPSETQKSSKDRKEDRNTSWTATSSQATIPLNPFGDFVVTSTLRQDCSLNFPTLPSSMIPLTTSSSQTYPASAPYSQTNVTSSFSIAQTSSNIGILSWSTLPSTDTYNPSRNNAKLARFHDIFHYRGSGNADVTSSVSSSYTNLSSEPKVQSNYIPSVSEHGFFNEPPTNIDSRSKTGPSYSSSTNRSHHFEASGKKNFSSNSKQTYDQAMPQYTNAPMIEGKQLCSQESQQYSTAIQSKQTMNSNFNKSNGKQISTSDAFARTSNSGKHVNYGICADPKETSQRTDLQFSVNTMASEPKPDDVHFNNEGKRTASNGVYNASKGRTSLGTYVTTNVSLSDTRMLQCNQNDTGDVVQQKNHFKPDQTHGQVNKQSHQMNQKDVQKQYQQTELHHQETNQVLQQQQQQSSGTSTTFGRSSKTTMSIHRPPVNWMTAPDIRSSLQNSPAFGNNQAFYIPDLQKDMDSTVGGSMFDANTFHCLDLPHSSSQIIYKSTDLQLLGNDQLENIHEPTAWSPSKSGNNNVLGSMLIPSTLPTLVGDLALGDSNANISRPFLPTFTSDSSPCSKKTSKRAHSMKNTEKGIEDGQVVPGAEFSSNFLSVSQLVDSGNRNKVRATALPVNRIITQTNIADAPCYPVSFPDQDLNQCQSKQTSKCPSNSYSAEALISNSAINSHQMSRKKRASNTSHYTSNYTSTDASGTYPATSSQSQCNFLPDLPVSRGNEFQGLSHSEPIHPSFMLPTSTCTTSSSHRNGIHPEDDSQIRRTVAQGSSDTLHLTGSMPTNKQANANSSNLLDVGMSYESNFPPFLPPVSVAMTHHPYVQEPLYSAPRFQMHPNANNHNGNIQSPSANTLTNFHLSTIFPEINGKVIC